MTFETTPAHQDIFDGIQNKDANMQVSAVAGSGKTTTLVQATKLIKRGEKAVFLAFSKAIQMELKDRLPSRVKAQTLNSLGLEIWRKFLREEGGVKNVDVQRNKTYKLWRELGNQGGFPGSHHKCSKAVMKLVGLAKTSGIIPDDDPREGLMPDTPETWEHLILYHNVQMPKTIGKLADEDAIRDIVVDHARTILRSSMELISRIDFDDMLWLPFAFKAKNLQFDRLFVDECQDLSPLNHELVRGVFSEVGQLVAVGDEYQAIFGFRGADVHSMKTLAAHFKTKSFPLHVSYRCPREVIALAQTLVPHIQAHPNADQGFVDIEPVKGHDAVAQNLLKPGDFVVSRTNAPAISLAQLLMKARVPVEVLGRDLALELQALIDGLGYDEVSKVWVSVPVFLDKIDEWESEFVEYAQENGWSSTRVEAIKDKAATLRELAQNVTEVEQVKAVIEELFQTPSVPAVRVSSIHKAKGLEADNVWLLNPELLPHPSAELDWEIQQETNLKYVAVTRAKHSLRYLSHGGK